MGLLTSDREEQGQKLYKDQLGEWDRQIRRTSRLRSGFEGIDDISDLSSKFGLTPFNLGGYKKDISSIYAPLQRALASRKGQRKALMSQNMPSSVANQYGAYNLIEGDYAGEFEDLLSKEAMQQALGYDKERAAQEFGAKFLGDVKARHGQFGLQREGLRGGQVGSKGSAIGDYLSTLSDTTLFEDILSGLGSAASFLTTPLSGGVDIMEYILGSFAGMPEAKGLKDIPGGVKTPKKNVPPMKVPSYDDILMGMG